MAFSVRQSRTLKAYCCLRGLENEVTSDFCLAPYSKRYEIGWIKMRPAYQYSHLHRPDFLTT